MCADNCSRCPRLCTAQCDSSARLSPGLPPIGDPSPSSDGLSCSGSYLRYIARLDRDRDHDAFLALCYSCSRVTGSCCMLQYRRSCRLLRCSAAAMLRCLIASPLSLLSALLIILQLYGPINTPIFRRTLNLKVVFILSPIPRPIQSLHSPASPSTLHTVHCYVNLPELTFQFCYSAETESL